MPPLISFSTYCGPRAAVVFSLAIILFLSACTTPYKSAKRTLYGGYADQKIGPNEFRVHFRGNAFTSRDKAIDYALLRSAQVALKNGFLYFLIVDGDEQALVGSETKPAHSYLGGKDLMYPKSVYGNFTTQTGQTYFLQKPRVSNRILGFSKRPAVENHIYEAKFIILTMRAKYALDDKIITRVGASP